MSKAGMFAGEVTPQAPADEALTDKYKGYWWMEYGTIITGLCGNASSLQQGQLLNVNGLFQTTLAGTISEVSPAAKGVSMSDSKIISFTFAFTKATAPNVGQELNIIDIYNADTSSSSLGVYIDSDGFINIVGRNVAGATILDVQVTNNGASFADGDLYFFAGAIDLSGTAYRELFVNAMNVGENAAYTTWNTYTDDILALADTGVSPNIRSYNFALNKGDGVEWAKDTYNGSLADDTLGYISFDDSCSLVAETVWDASGWVRDPQSWSGWYLTQPKIFYGASFWINTGTLRPDEPGGNDLELAFGNYIDGDLQMAHYPPEDSILNRGIGGTTGAS